MQKFKTKQIEKARKRQGMTRADLVRAIQKKHPHCSAQLVYLWETQGVVPSPFYQKIIGGIFKDVQFYSTRPATGLKTR